MWVQGGGRVLTLCCEHPPEHPAGTRGLPSLSACLWREEAASLSIASTTTSLSLAHREVSACAHTRARTHTHTHTFSRSTIKEASIDTHQTRRPLFPLEWEGHQKLSNHHSEKTLSENKTERIRVKEAKWLNPSVSPLVSQPHHEPESNALLRPHSPAQEQERLHNRKDTST